MHAPKTKAEIQQQKAKLANSYSELLDQFSSKELRHVGNYTIGKLIGKGAFGKVYLARHDLTNGSKVVLKASKKDDTNLAREIHHHRQFIHPHIARLYEVIVTENQVWLALEYCPGDELYNYLCKRGALPVETAQKIFTQLVGAVAYIHSKSCVHRDLKLENVLLDKHENVKLCDFGFTREYDGKASYLQTFCGTVCYSAPEMLKGEKYAGEKVDVWSLGIILFALLKGELPFDEDNDMQTKAKILSDDPIYPETFPDAAKTLISKLLNKRPFHRPTLSEILADPFLIDHAPHQQAVLKLTQPAPFTTTLEKTTLERMKSAGVDIDKVIENVLSQRCDPLAGWWALLIEKEARKEAKRELKRKEREAEMKILRRLSGASSRLDRLSIALEQVDEEARTTGGEQQRSGSRGRTAHRRSTPQILISDLPRLPEGSAVDTPGKKTPPPPVDKDSIRSQSNSRSRPPVPNKERKRRSSTLQLVATNPDLLGPVNGVNKRRSGKRRNNHFLSQLTALKHWFVESTKRAKSPTTNENQQNKSIKNSVINSESNPLLESPLQIRDGEKFRPSTGARSSPEQNRTSLGSLGTPTITKNATTPRVETAKMSHRNSLSPSPLTPRSSYRRRSGGLRGRKSTSSSVSSIRSLPRHTHSKASSRSSNSLEIIHSPGSHSVGRSPHSSVKVLPATPTGSHFPSNIRLVRSPPSEDHHRSTFNESAILAGQSSGIMFARRKKTPFKGPTLNAGLFGMHVTPSHGSPAIRNRDASDGKLNLGLRDLARRASGPKRKSNTIEEEDEDGAVIEEEEDDVEEVDVFSPVDLAVGERVHSITIWDDPPDAAIAAVSARKMKETIHDQITT